MEMIDRQAALDVTRETVFVEYEDDDPRKEESIILQTKAAIRERIEALPPIPAIPVEWINSYIETCNLLDLRVNVPASKIISVMVNTWRQETKSDAIDCIASVWATKQEAEHDT